MALLVSVLALVVATGGVSAYAGAKIATKDIKRGAVTSAKIKDQAVRTRDLSAEARGALTGPAGAPGAPGISGYERVQAYATLAPGDTSKVVAAQCPAGKRLLGGGGYSQDNEMYLMYAYPQTNEVFSVTAVLRPGGAADAGSQVSAVAICANVS